MIEITSSASQPPTPNGMKLSGSAGGRRYPGFSGSRGISWKVCDSGFPHCWQDIDSSEFGAAHDAQTIAA
jgi:hypothetical protein